MGCHWSAGKAEKYREEGANNELLEIIEFLLSTPIFSALDHGEYPLLAKACIRQVYAEGETVAKQGEVGTDFFVVQDGRAGIWMLVDASTPKSPTSPASSSRGKLSDCEEHKHPVKVGSLRKKDYFGERALISSETWSVTILAESQELVCIKIAKEQFWELELQNKLQIPRRASINGDMFNSQPLRPALRPSLTTFLAEGTGSTMLRPRMKNGADRDFIRTVLRSNEALVSAMHDLAVIEALVDVAWKEELAANQVVVAPGTDSARPSMFVVQEGRLRVAMEEENIKPGRASGALLRASQTLSRASQRMSMTMYQPRRSMRRSDKPSSSKSALSLDRLLGTVSWMSQGSSAIKASPVSDETVPDENTAGEEVIEVEMGACHGEFNLLYEVSHLTTVRSVTPSVVWRIDQDGYNRAPELAVAKRTLWYCDILDGIEVFSPLLSEEKREISKALVEAEFPQGHVFFHEGDTVQVFYVLMEGEVAVSSQGSEIARLTSHATMPNASLGIAVDGRRHDKQQPKFFGESALAVPAPLRTTITPTVVSESAKCLTLTRQALDACEHFMPEVKADGMLGAATARRTIAQGIVQQVRIDYRSLKHVAVLGKGGFGFVELCEDPKTQQNIALKTIRKARVAKSKHLKKQVVNEKYILDMTNSPFITRLFQTDQSEQEIFFLLEPCLGGELFAVYVKQRLFGLEVHARYYAASIALAFEHLHERFIIYRDLKPENLLLNQEGRLKLTDMGLAKFVVGKTYTVCGTPSFFAPEVVRHGGYTCAADWWQLGILTWELLTGKTPFEAQSTGEAVYWLLTHCVLADLEEPSYAWHKNITEGAKEFLKGLLVYDPHRRLRMVEHGLEPFRKTAWFKDFEWPDLVSGVMEPPYTPAKVDLKAGQQLNNFNNMVANVDDAEYVDDGTGWDEGF